MWQTANHPNSWNHVVKTMCNTYLSYLSYILDIIFTKSSPVCLFSIHKKYVRIFSKLKLKMWNYSYSYLMMSILFVSDNRFIFHLNIFFKGGSCYTKLRKYLFHLNFDKIDNSFSLIVSHNIFIIYYGLDDDPFAVRTNGVHIFYLQWLYKKKLWMHLIVSL